MKDLIKKFKETIGIDTDVAVMPEPAIAPSPAASVSVIPPAVEKPIDMPATTAISQGLPPAPQKREAIIQFVVNSLQPYKDEKNTGIIGLDLFVHCATDEEEELAKVALYTAYPDKFKTRELRRKLQDNYIELPSDWFFGIHICRDGLPECHFKKGSLGLNIVVPQQKARQVAVAKLTVLAGQTAEETYLLDAAVQTQYYIGRGKNPQLASGKSHTNDIVFLTREDAGYDAIKGASNPFVSRNHAIITYNQHENQFFLYADKGGLPESGNKTKIFKAAHLVERLDIYGVAHALENGDQIELGGEARLRFEIG